MTRRLFFLLLLVILFPLSAFAVRSDELSTRETQDGNTVQIEYIDSSGIVTYAEDKHYAILRKTLDEAGHPIQELYFDEKDRPTPQPVGHYGVRREYNENGKLTTIIYLGKNAEEAPVSGGYSRIVRTLTADGNNIQSNRYECLGEPAVLWLGQSGEEFSYDAQGRRIQTTYLDTTGQPMLTLAGYSSVRYVLDADGRIEKEFYFDLSGQPAASHGAQYGVWYRERDEKNRVIELVYLGVDGTPSPLPEGYTILRRVYDEHGKLRDEYYYNQEGTPTALSRGQYGLRHKENSKLVYLDKNHNELFRLDLFLHQNQGIVFLSVFLLFLLILFLPRPLQKIFLVLYLLFILYMTLFVREGGEPHKRFEIFYAYQKMLATGNLNFEPFNNILLFIPLGGLLYALCPKKRVLFIPFVVSALIESIQYFGGYGLCELDDVINNTLGGCFGALLYSMLFTLHRKYS